jgi:hypothetical protein
MLKLISVIFLGKTSDKCHRTPSCDMKQKMEVLIIN